MNKKLVLSGVFSSLLLFSCNQDSQPAQQAEALTYSVIEVPTKSVVGFNSYPANVEGTNNSDIRAKVSGYITKVLVDEGEAVRKGQILFTLETQAMSQDAQAAKANVNAAQVEVDRLIPLVEKGIVGDVQLETAKARLAQAKSNYSSIAANIDYANIRSSINGNVGAINFREGALVSPADPKPLTTVSATDEVYVYFALNEKDYLDFISHSEGKTRDEKIENSPLVKLQMANGEIYSEKGKIETVTGQVDKTTGTVRFRAKFNNSNGILANGSSGTVLIPQEYKNVTVIPEVATYEQQGVHYVYTVRNDTAYSTIVDIQDRIDRMAIVNSGVQPGDKVVVEGIVTLRNATPIVEKVVPFDSLVKALKPVF